MDMLLIVLVVALAGLGMTVALFWAEISAMRKAAAEIPAEPERRFVIDAPHFFARPITVTAAGGSVDDAIPIDDLLRQLETRVLLEQAAEASVETPPPLRMPPLSALVH